MAHPVYLPCHVVQLLPPRCSSVRICIFVYLYVYLCVCIFFRYHGLVKYNEYKTPHIADCFEIWRADALWDPGVWELLKIHFLSNPRWPTAGQSAKVASVSVSHSHYRISRFEMERYMWNLKQWVMCRLISIVVTSPNLVFAPFISPFKLVWVDCKTSRKLRKTNGRNFLKHQ